MTIGSAVRFVTDCSMHPGLNLCISKDFPIHVDIRSMELTILCLRGHRKKFLNYFAFLFLKVVLILANNEDPIEM